MELVASARLLFLDESTLRLDSTTSEDVIGFLQTITAEKGVNVIVFFHFDNIILLGIGVSVCLGATKPANDYFQGHF